MNSEAIKVLRDELDKIQSAQAEMITPEGMVRSGQTYRYAELVRLARTLKESIEYLTVMYEGRK